jgi:hypothetical protein
VFGLSPSVISPRSESWIRTSPILPDVCADPCERNMTNHHLLAHHGSRPGAARVPYARATSCARSPVDLHLHLGLSTETTARTSGHQSGSPSSVSTKPMILLEAKVLLMAVHPPIQSLASAYCLSCLRHQDGNAVSRAARTHPATHKRCCRRFAEHDFDDLIL